MNKVFVLPNCEESQPSRDLKNDIIKYAEIIKNFTNRYDVKIDINYNPDINDGTLEINFTSEDNNEVAASAALISIMSASMILGARRVSSDNWKEIMSEAWQVIVENADAAGEIMADMAYMQVELADRLRIKESRGPVEPMVIHKTNVKVEPVG